MTDIDILIPTATTRGSLPAHWSDFADFSSTAAPPCGHPTPH